MHFVGSYDGSAVAGIMKKNNFVKLDWCHVLSFPIGGQRKNFVHRFKT